MAIWDEIREAVGGVTEAVGPSVVGIGGSRWGRGSGFVIADGKVLTNAHNLRGGEVEVTFADGHAAAGTVSGVDADGDLAVVSVDTAGAPVLAWAADGPPTAGSAVFAVSNPGGRGVQVTVGFVSSSVGAFRGPRGRKIHGSIEHTAPLARGSSGSPVVDERGAVLGVNTNRLGEGFYAAIPADAGLRDRVDALGRGESPARPRLGVGVAPSHVARRLRRAVGLPEMDGLLIRSVEDGSPAGRAGIEQGDLLVAVAGTPIASVDDLWTALDGVAGGGSFEVKVVRGTEERTVAVSLATSEAAEATGEA
jgi:S1-C subfamily serine protease